jgi:ABC-type polysaccharide/polyol phosphate export permease
MAQEPPQQPQKPAVPRRAKITRIRARETGSVNVLDADQLIVETARGIVAFRSYIREMIERRSLIGVLAGRELKSNYEMNVVGFAWWLLEPLTMTLVYFVLINVVSGTTSCSSSTPPTFDQSYRLLIIMTATLAFKWLTSSVVGAMGVVRGNASLVTDVYFPRGLLPITEIVVGLAHYLVGLLVLPIFMLLVQDCAHHRIGPSWSLIWLPVVMAVQFVFTLGLVYPLAVWGLNYRNLPGLMGNVLRLWFYLSPALWPLANVKNPRLRLLVQLNPLTGIFQGYRRAIIDHTVPDWTLYYTLVLGVVMMVIGGWYFSRREPQFGKML